MGEKRRKGFIERDVRVSKCEDSVAEWSKAIDLKSIILWMRRFKSCHCRFFKKIIKRVSSQYVGTVSMWVRSVYVYV